MISNYSNTLLFKYIFLVFALMPVLIGVLAYFNPENVTVNGEQADLDIFDYLILGGFGFIFLMLHLLFSPHFVQIQLGGQNITILDDDENRIVNWFDVDSLTKFWFVFPPLYRLRIKDEEGYYLFTTQTAFIDTGVGTIDLSSMGSLIRRKKKELGI
ncbi:MAG: hypothetical protein RIG68_25580 [Imperialibacter sp.]|uniref:hypothetical protein n=1 Tax=Imperialibacter sp. TaxID=2038411 RepID=UPI0032ECBBD3